jgi:hypothetical protein
MTDWTTVDLDTLLPGEPWTSGKALAVYENPIAIAEGAAGAPKVRGWALDTFLFQGTFENAGLAIIDLDRLQAVSFHGIFTQSDGTARDIQVRLSSDNGDTWGSYQNILRVADQMVAGWVNIKTGLYRAVTLGNAISGAGTVPGAGGTVNAIEFRTNAAGTFNGAIFAIGEFG